MTTARRNLLVPPIFGSQNTRAYIFPYSFFNTAEEVETQLGIRSHFSLRAVIQIAIESGFAEYGAKLPTATSITDAMMEAGALDIAQQLATVAVVGGNFSIEEVVESMASAGVGYEMQGKLMPNNGKGMTAGERDVATVKIDLGSTLASGIVQGIFDGGMISKEELEGDMANFVGTVIGQGIAARIQESSALDDRQSQLHQKMSESVSSHPQLRAVQEENIVQEIEDELSSDLHSIEAFFDPSVTQPNAQVSGKVASAQQKTSQANAMRRFGLHAQQQRVLNHADANGNYLGTGLGLKDDPKIDDFDAGATSSGSGVSKMPTERKDPTLGSGLGLKDVGAQGILATTERVAAQAEKLYPGYKDAYIGYTSAANTAYKNMAELGKVMDDEMGTDLGHALEWSRNEAEAVRNINLSAKYGFYSGASRVLSNVSLAATGMEVVFGAHDVYVAPAGEKLDVGIHVGGELAAGWGGREFGAAGAARALVTIGSALEIEPGPGTVLGTTILAATAVGFGAVKLFDAVEPAVRSHIEESYSDINTRFGRW